jgi:hypothetical protein
MRPMRPLPLIRALNFQVAAKTKKTPAHHGVVVMLFAQPKQKVVRSN